MMQPTQKQGIYLTTEKMPVMPPLPSRQQTDLYRPGSSTPTTPNMFKPIQQMMEQQGSMQNIHMQPIMMNQSHSQAKYPLRTESSRSQNKPDTNGYMEQSMRYLKERMYKMGKQLFEHYRLLNEIRYSKLSGSTVSGNGSDYSTNNLLPLEASRIIRQELDFESQKTQTKILTAVEDLRREFSERYTRKEDFTMMVFNYIQELKGKLQSESRTAFESLWRDIESIKLTNFDRQSSGRLDKEVAELRQQTYHLRQYTIHLRKQLDYHEPFTFFTTSRRFNNPRLLRYKETLQMLQPTTLEPLSEYIAINEVTYYLDRDGYLLDRNHCYLLDHSNRQIQLEQRHLALLHSYNLLS